MALTQSVTIVTNITRIIGISNANTGLFFCQKYKVNTINVNAASIWLLAPNMGQSTHATCLASVELGRDTFTKTSNIAGKIAAMVATYLGNFVFELLHFIFICISFFDGWMLT
jgi:hypothetical protein